MMWGWLATLVLLAHVRGVERRPLASLRLARPTEKDITIAGYLGGAALGWQWLTSQLLPTTATAGAQEGQDTLVGLGPLLALALVMTVSITEEILWRGYAVERVGAWIGRVPAALIGLAIFALGHVTFFGASWLLTNLPGAIAVYAVLLWRRNLWACMFCHAVLDLPIVLVAVLAALT